MIPFLFASLVTGSGHIVCEYKKHYPLIYLLKPLTIVLIMVAVYLNAPLNQYTQWILAGLGFSMLGDIFLMLKKQQFIAGLLSFLVAHILYIVAFFSQLSAAPELHYLLAFALPGLLIYGFLYPGLKHLKWPVLIYVSAIMLMGYCSFAVYLAQPTSQTLAAFIGAVVFMVSDATLAVNKFRFPFKAAQAIILSTYYIAQWFIALSCL